jgi:fatty-acyl-CoA synthase
MMGETPEKTWEQLGKWICNTHWKDSYADPDNKRGYQLCLVGDGDIPLRDIFACLKSNGYDGYLTLEWEKMWAPEIDEPDIAFPAYVQYMRRLVRTV